MPACCLVINTKPSEPTVPTPAAAKQATHVADCLFAPDDPRHARAVEIIAINLDAFADEREMLDAEALADARDTEPAPAPDFSHEAMVREGTALAASMTEATGLSFEFHGHGPVLHRQPEAAIVVSTLGEDD